MKIIAPKFGTYRRKAYRALACTVLTEQAINVVLLEFQREISKYKVLATWVSEINVFNLYHNL